MGQFSIYAYTIFAFLANYQPLQACKSVKSCFGVWNLEKRLGPIDNFSWYCYHPLCSNQRAAQNMDVSKAFSRHFRYSKMTNIGHGLIDMLSTLWVLIFGGHFVLVSAYQDFKIYHHINKISIIYAKNIFLHD